MIYKWWVPETIKDKEVGCYEKKTSPDFYLLYRSRLLNKTEFSLTPKIEFIISQKKC